MAEQDGQQFVLHGREVHFLVVEEHLPLRQIDPEVMQHKNQLCLPGAPSGQMSQGDADPCQELTGIERLRQIVVGAGVERPHFVLFLFTRGYDDNGRERPLTQKEQDIQ